jgi:hypothetical protein
MLAKKVALPYPVLLVVGGLALGFVPGLPAVICQASQSANERKSSRVASAPMILRSFRPRP